jgi:hypothetical protein
MNTAAKLTACFADLLQLQTQETRAEMKELMMKNVFQTSAANS